MGTPEERKATRRDEARNHEEINSKDRARYKRDPLYAARKKAAAHAYRKRNREKTAARSRARYRQNSDQMLARARRYREKNPEQIKARKHAYYLENRERLRAKHRTYYRENRDKINAQNRAYREKNQERDRARRQAYYRRNRKRIDAKNREWARRNVDRARAIKRASDRRRGDQRHAYYRLRKYGLTPERWNQLLAEQGNVCALCRNSFTGTRSPSVDHDHQTGRVRGLVHQSCHVRIGWYEIFQRLSLQERDAIAHYLAEEGVLTKLPL